MYEAKLVHGLDSERNLSHIEPRDILRKDLVLDEHGHEIPSRQELHEHVQERRVLERRVQLDQPWTIRVGENVTLSSDVCQLVLLVL